MLHKGIVYKARVWARAAGETARFIGGHKIASLASALALMAVVQILLFGGVKGILEVQIVVSVLTGGLCFLSPLFLWNLVWAPYQIERDREVEWMMIIAEIQNQISALRNENSDFKVKLYGQKINLGSVGRLEELFREGEAILKVDVGEMEMFLDWRERVSSWNALVLNALPKSEQIGFETIAAWSELNMPVGKTGMGGAVNGHMRNGKAYMHTKTIKLRKIIMRISSM